ncbi:TolC family outer membrane protein [Leptothrix discophora]|uniref:TolC family outer membrane protein n=1 Tax=Leptothrix discophora TaxID=89 RepID=A0ABT9G195_LEPDI|nr:TolC family outer membrane protein [Leptothrix discophora]MDP4300264.1 TolC family outer membrane protein [Leptothrix discophora]
MIGRLALASQLALVFPAWSQAPVADPLKDAAQRAISSNPEVTARLNAFRASVDEVGVARGSYLPKVDLSADAARIRDRFDNRTPQSTSMTSTGIALTATQLLWDGLSTVNQVQRLDHARLVRYFEFIDASEQTALESARAYFDVSRARKLVQLAEDNYVQHRQVYEQIQSRVKAGVGRGVDLEQVGARLALAESNLATETANLHDVTERYRRVVGALPPAQLPMVGSLDRSLPGTAGQAVEQSVKRNAVVAAAVENYRSSQSQSKERDGLWHPRVEARLRTGAGNNFDGVPDQRRETSAGVYLNWNLFNGGADQSRIRQSANLLNQAADQRDKACRDARQTAAIAFNDVRTQAEQIGYLDRNVQATTKARDAYRQQFDIGQRSLLDVLNADNELYVARRALTSAEHDLAIAKARTHASASTLVAVLGLVRASDANEEPEDGRFWQAGDDAATRCPISATELALTTKTDLDTRARQTAPVEVSAVTAAPAAAPLPSARALPPAERAEAPLSSSVSQRLLDWAAAWSTKDVTRYLSFYDAKFQPTAVSRKKWFDNRTKLLRKAGPIDLRISNVQRKTISPTQVETRFDQAYSSGSVKDNSQKVLTWQRRGTEWYIVKESSR